MGWLEQNLFSHIAGGWEAQDQGRSGSWWGCCLADVCPLILSWHGGEKGSRFSSISSYKGCNPIVRDPILTLTSSPKPLLTPLHWRLGLRCWSWVGEERRGVGERHNSDRSKDTGSQTLTYVAEFTADEKKTRDSNTGLSATRVCLLSHPAGPCIMFPLQQALTNTWQNDFKAFVSADLRIYVI